MCGSIHLSANGARLAAIKRVSRDKIGGRSNHENPGGFVDPPRLVPAGPAADANRHLEGGSADRTARSRLQPRGSGWETLDAAVHHGTERRHAGVLPVGRLVTLLQDAARRAAG